MKKQLIGAGSAAILLMAASGVHAGQGCSSITDYSSTWAVSGADAESLDLLGASENKMPWRMSLDYSYVNANQLIMGSDRISTGPLGETWIKTGVTAQGGDTGIGVGVRNRYQKTVLGISYDFSSRLMAGVSIPYVNNERWEDHHHMSDYTAKGIGDITVYGRYWMKQEKDGFNTYIEAALGLPTGTSDAMFTSIPQNVAPPNTVTQPKAGYIQVGLGQYVPTIAAGFETNLMEKTSLFGRAQFSDPLGENNVGYRSQSTLMANMGASHTFAAGNQSIWGVSGQFNYLFARFRKDTKTALTFAAGSGALIATRPGVEAGNTGGTWLDFQPGIFYSPDGGKLMFTASVPLSVHYHVNSLQTFAPWSLNLGVSQRF